MRRRKAFPSRCRISDDMIRPIAALMLLASCCLAQSVTRTYTIKGRTIVFQATTFADPLQITESNGALDQSTPVNCLRLAWSRLKAMDLESASQLSLDPKGELELRTKHRQRVGEAMFRELSSKIIEKAPRFTHELMLRHEHALVSENGFVVLFRWKDGKFFLETIETAKADADATDLNTVANALTDGKLRIE